MSAPEIERLADDMGKPGALRDLIHAARHDAPNEQQLGALMSRLDQIEGAAGAGAGAGILKLLPVIAVVVLAAGTAFWTLRSDSNDKAPVVIAQSVEERTVAVEERIVDVEPAKQDPVLVQVQRAPAPEQEQGARAEAPENVTAKRPEPAAKTLGQSEPDLVQAARRALQSQSWDQSMGLVRSHERQYPEGILIEEREAIAIEALASSGQLSLARTRLRAMRRDFPGSSYRAHLESLLGMGTE